MLRQYVHQLQVRRNTNLSAFSQVTGKQKQCSLLIRDYFYLDVLQSFSLSRCIKQSAPFYLSFHLCTVQTQRVKLFCINSRGGFVDPFTEISSVNLIYVTHLFNIRGRQIE